MSCMFCSAPKYIENEFYVLEQAKDLSEKLERFCGIVHPCLCKECADKMGKKSKGTVKQLQQEGKTEMLNNLLLTLALKELENNSIEGRKGGIFYTWIYANTPNNVCKPIFIPEKLVVYNTSGTGKICHEITGGTSEFVYLRYCNANNEFRLSISGDTGTQTAFFSPIFFPKTLELLELALNQRHTNLEQKDVFQPSKTIKPRTCNVCGRENLKYTREKIDSKIDMEAICCVRCKADICLSCRKTLPKYSDDSRDGQLCPVCNQYTIYDLSGKDDYSQLLMQAESRYGVTKR